MTDFDGKQPSFINIFMDFRKVFIPLTTTIVLCRPMPRDTIQNSINYYDLHDGSDKHKDQYVYKLVRSSSLSFYYTKWDRRNRTGKDLQNIHTLEKPSLEVAPTNLQTVLLIYSFRFISAFLSLLQKLVFPYFQLPNPTKQAPKQQIHNSYCSGLFPPSSTQN